MEEKKIVLLIDAENTSAKFADCIENYITSKGDVISAQIYGDFIDNNNTKQWNGKAAEYNLQRYQADTTKAGKNAADIKLVIDAMDFLYKENPADIFCIVTSDGDFTSLVERIRKEGISVIGMGKADASPRLRRACSEYVELEVLYDDLIDDNIESESDDEVGQDKGLSAKDKTAVTKTKKEKSSKNKAAKEKTAGGKDKESGDKAVAKSEPDKKPETKTKKSSASDTKTGKSAKTKQKDTKEKDAKTKAAKLKKQLKDVKMLINELVQLDESQGKNADLGGIKSRLQLKIIDFDEHDFGYKSIRELIDNETKFHVIQEGTRAYVVSSKKEKASVKKEQALLEKVCSFILETYPEKTIGKNEVGSLGRKLKVNFEDFNYKDYGYSRLSLFLKELGMNIL